MFCVFRSCSSRDSLHLLTGAQVSFMSIPIYSMLPAVQEWVIEKGWTRAYSRVSQVCLHRLFLLQQSSASGTSISA